MPRFWSPTFPAQTKITVSELSKRQHADSCRIHCARTESGYIPHSNRYALSEKLQGMHQRRFGRTKEKGSPETCRNRSQFERLRHYLFGLPDLVGRFTDGSVHLFGKQRLCRKNYYSVLHSRRKRRIGHSKTHSISLSQSDRPQSAFHARTNGTKFPRCRKARYAQMARRNQGKINRVLNRNTRQR